jgi:hypothetical protein
MLLMDFQVPLVLWLLRSFSPLQLYLLQLYFLASSRRDATIMNLAVAGVLSGPCVLLFGTIQMKIAMMMMMMTQNQMLLYGLKLTVWIIGRERIGIFGWGKVPAFLFARSKRGTDPPCTIDLGYNALRLPIDHPKINVR